MYNYVHVKVLVKPCINDYYFSSEASNLMMWSMEIPKRVPLNACAI